MGSMNELENKQVLVVGVAGASGSGKSLFTRRVCGELKEKFQIEAQVIEEDSYYRDQSQIDFETRCKVNYDHPDAFEHELLVGHLDRWKKRQEVEIPIYDYSTHNRSVETKTINIGTILMVEGILVLHDIVLRSQMDVKLFVDVPLEECLSRRMDRDIKERGRDEESVRNQFESMVIPMFKKFVEPSKRYADLLVTTGGENDVAVKMVAAGLASKISEV